MLIFKAGTWGIERENIWSKRGFTLLEVMIALAIMAIGLVAIFRSLVLSLDAFQQARVVSLSTFLAQSELAEIEEESYPEVGRWGGDFGKTYPHFSWERIVSQTEVKDLRKVLLRVYWKEGKKERSLELLTYRSKKG